MSNKNNLNLGNEIKDILKDALNNNNFKNLNQNIELFAKNTVSKLKEKSRQSFNYKNFFVPAGKSRGVIFTVFGAIGTLSFGLSILVLTVLSLPFGRLFNMVSLILLPFFIASIVSLVKGIKTLTRLKRAKTYIYSMKGSSYFLIEDLSRKTGLSAKFIEEDLFKMINLGIFPEGHIDTYNSYFILNDETYKQYSELQKHIQEKKEKEELNKIKDESLNPHIRRVREEGQEFLLQIKQANEEIQGKEVSLKLERLEKITEKIFECVEKNPKKLAEIRKFTGYFLPTTLKLIETYKNLESEPIKGENISKTKSEIEETLDSINTAFENLLDGLFEEVAMDISTDISVLETMLAQEGLTTNNKIDNDKNN